MTMNAVDIAQRISTLVQLVRSDSTLDQASPILADVWGRDRLALAEAFKRVWADDGQLLPDRAACIHGWLVGVRSIP